MNIKHLRIISFVLLGITITSGCTTQRWLIEQAETSSIKEDRNTKAINSILLDKQTGDTWLLWPNKESGKIYQWIKLENNIPEPVK